MTGPVPFTVTLSLVSVPFAFTLFFAGGTSFPVFVVFGGVMGLLVVTEALSLYMLQRRYARRFKLS